MFILSALTAIVFSMSTHAAPIRLAPGDSDQFGSDTVRITTDHQWMLYKSKARQIPGQPLHLYSVSMDGKVTADLNAGDFATKQASQYWFTPDSKRVALTHRVKTGERREGEDVTYTELYSVPLTQPEKRVKVLEAASIALYPPSNGWIPFVSSPKDCKNKQTIGLASYDGSKVIRVIELPSDECAGGTYIKHVTPTQVLYELEVPEPGEDGEDPSYRHEIRLVSIDGSNDRLLLVKYEDRAVVLPESNFLLLQKGEGPGSVFSVLDLDDPKAKPVELFKGEKLMPLRWTADRSQLIYHRVHADGTQTLMVGKLDGSAQTQLLKLGKDDHIDQDDIHYYYGKVELVGTDRIVVLVHRHDNDSSRNEFNLIALDGSQTTEIPAAKYLLDVTEWTVQGDQVIALGSAELGDSEIWAFYSSHLNGDPSTVRQLGFLKNEPQHLRFVPGSSARVVYQLINEMGYVADLDGGLHNQRHLGFDAPIEFLRDGRYDYGQPYKLFFATDKAGEKGLFVEALR